MELNITGIKCDTRHCNYRDDDVKFEDYPKWINRPCPVCSGNLLTQKDYDSCVSMYKKVKIITALRWVNPFFYINVLYRFLFKQKGKVSNLQVKYENDGSITKTITTDE